MRLSRIRPAQATRMSRRPKAALAPSMSASTDSREVTSQAIALALPPSLEILPAVSSAGAASRSETTTAAPSAASRAAVAAPMPRPDPVMPATLFSNLIRTPLSPKSPPVHLTPRGSTWPAPGPSRPRPDPRPGWSLRHHAARRPGRRGHQGRAPRRGRRDPPRRAAARGREPLLPRREPQQERDRRRHEGSGRARGPGRAGAPFGHPGREFPARRDEPPGPRLRDPLGGQRAPRLLFDLRFRDDRPVRLLVVPR